jgi:hypothetical protein
MFLDVRDGITTSSSIQSMCYAGHLAGMATGVNLHEQGTRRAMMKTMKKLMTAVLFFGLVGVAAQASLIAADSADDSAYDSGWANGSNGGYGFGAWSLSTSIADTDRNGHFIGSSANNGVAPPSGNIDTAGRSWGLYANGSDAVNNALSAGYRPFTGALSVGQTLTLSMDNGLIDTSYLVGFTLLNSDPATPLPFGVLPNSNTRFGFSFVGGEATYQLSLGDGVGGVTTINTGFGFTDGGMNLAFTLLANDEYSFSINGGTPLTGSLGGTFGEAINGVAVYNYRAGPDSGNDAFFNSMSIVPEPSTAMLIGVGLFALVGLRRRV